MKQKWTEIICADCGIHFAVEMTFAIPRIQHNQAVAQAADEKQGPEIVTCPNGCEVAPIKADPLENADLADVVAKANRRINEQDRKIKEWRDCFDRQVARMEEQERRIVSLSEELITAKNQVRGLKGALSRKKK